MRRRRWRTAVLWVGCTLCVLVAAAFVVSARWWVWFQVPNVGDPSLYLRAGSVSLVRESMVSAPLFVEGHSLGLSRWNSWTAQWVMHGSKAGPIYTWAYFEFPIWLLFLTVLLPTLLVWRFVPKFPRGHCRRCGYNLTGLTEARCPECGAGFDARRRRGTEDR